MKIALQTPRLSLRPFVGADQGDLAELFADEAVRQHLAMAPMGRKGAAAFADRFITAAREEWREGDCGALALRLHEEGTTAGSINGSVIGYCGLRLLPDRISGVELLYALGQSHWGHGLATEAAEAVLAWGFSNLGVREILAFTRPDHTASRRVMEKLGMISGGETDRYYGETLAQYSISRGRHKGLNN